MDRLRHAGTIALVALATPAYADHDHHHPAAASEPTSSLTATIGALAASYESRLYEGDYQGASLGVAWSYRRIEVAARGLAYQIDRNGKTSRGFGDLMVHGAVRAYEAGAFSAGGHLMVMAPTGEAMTGLGMGHWMLMPAAWAAYAPRFVTVSGALGYARGLGGANVHAEHGGGGAWPLVDPMSFSEVTFDALAMFPITKSFALGARVLGAMPLDDDTRTIGAARISWRAGRLETLAEAQAGITGDPVKFRGLVSTSMTF